MPRPQTLLTLLLGCAIGAAGLLQGLHWKSSSGAADLAGLEQALRRADEENQMLKRENESLRSLAQGGGALAVPQELIDRVEKEFGLRYLSGPVVHRIAMEELRDRIAAAVESRFGPSGIEDRQEAYRLIGWLRPGDNLLAQLTAVRAVGVKGWFDDVSGEGWVTDRFEIENIPDQAALLRLLVRILLHQHFPPPPGYPGDDAARAREALHHGSAAGAEARYYAANARAIGFMPMKQDLEVEQMFSTLPAFVQGITTFPGNEGKGFADTLHVTGNEALHAVLRDPPQSTRRIFYPAEEDKAAPIELPESAEEAYLEESAGMLGLRLWLDELGDVGLAQELASKWRGDRYRLFPDGESSVALLWQIECADETAADALEERFLVYLAALGNRDAAPARGEVVRQEDGGRHLKVSRPGPKVLRFVNAFLAGTAESL